MFKSELGQHRHAPVLPPPPRVCSFFPVILSERRASRRNPEGERRIMPKSNVSLPARHDREKYETKPNSEFAKDRRHFLIAIESSEHH